MPPSIVCLGVPYNLGDDDPQSAVYQIEATGFADSIDAKWVTVRADFAVHENPLVAVNMALADAIQRHAPAFPIIFAADCMMSLGAVKGLDKPDLGLVWFDAHGDFNTPETTPSNFIGGMPLAMLVGRGDQSIMKGLSLQPLAESRILISDARNLDPLEGEALAASQITHIKYVSGISAAPLPRKPFHIHLDTDVIDPSEFPALAYPEPHGATISEMIEALRYLGYSKKAVGLHISVWDPARTSDQDHHLQVVIKLARHFVDSLAN